MLQVLISAVFSMLLLVGCGGPRYIDYFPYHDDGTPKPRVAVMPIIDSSQSGLTWDVSKELSDELYYSLMDSGQLYVLSPSEMGTNYPHPSDLFGSDLTVTREVCNTDFIVALELIDHSVVPCTQADSQVNSKGVYHPFNNVVNLSMRVRVIDVRRQTPRVILYEVLKCGYVITPSNNGIDYSTVCYGSNEFVKTPYGIAHQRMTKNLSTRLEGIIQSTR